MNKLWDISSWNQDETWKNWYFGDCPPHCSAEADILLDTLHGMTSISANKKDKRGWGRTSGRYTVAEGYSTLKAVPWAAPNPTSWLNLWNYPSLPKIDLFCWTMLHNSILTWENLKRRGREGPSRCPLCASHEETVDHLLLHYPFLFEVSNSLVGSLNLNLPNTLSSIFLDWPNLAPFPLSKLTLLKHCWMWIPKLICWKLWLEINNRVLRDTFGTPTQTAIRLKMLVGELASVKTSLKNEKLLEEETFSWFQALSPILLSRIKTQTIQVAPWEIRLEEQDFIKWRSSLDNPVLMFDGASKGNPGNAGGGGILLDASRKVLLSFAWGLGQTSNKNAEFLALSQGLIQAKALNLSNLTVIGDSRVTIHACSQRKRPKDVLLNQIYKRILLQAKEFESISFYHVLRSLNHLADHKANVGAYLSKGVIITNGNERYPFINRLSGSNWQVRLASLQSQRMRLISDHVIYPFPSYQKQTGLPHARVRLQSGNPGADLRKIRPPPSRTSESPLQRWSAGRILRLDLQAWKTRYLIVGEVYNILIALLLRRPSSPSEEELEFQEKSRNQRYGLQLGLW